MKSEKFQIWENLKNYKAFEYSNELAELIWTEVEQWQYFEKKIIGTQITRSADSIAANIVEGFGRFHYKEKIRFYHIARGSLLETLNWLNKCRNRGIIKENHYQKIYCVYSKIPYEINILISNTAKQIGKNS